MGLDVSLNHVLRVAVVEVNAAHDVKVLADLHLAPNGQLARPSLSTTKFAKVEFSRLRS